MPAQGLYLLLHKPWQPPATPQPAPIMGSRDYDILEADRKTHAQLLRDVPVLRAAAAAGLCSQAAMLADMAAARWLLQLDQVGCCLGGRRCGH
jgi:hypothetical protein